MKPIVVLVSMAVVGIMTLFVFIYVKHNDKVTLFETFSKLDTRYQASRYEINEYMADIAVMQDDMETAIKQTRDLTTEMEKIRVSIKLKKDQLEACRGEEFWTETREIQEGMDFNEMPIKTMKKQRNDEMQALEGQRKNAEEQFKKEKATWTSEIAALEKQLAGKSNVCKFVNMTIPEVKRLCGNVQPAALPK